MPEVQVDRGAIRFVLGGAHIMCPGLTSPGGRMDEELPAETPVVRQFVSLSARPPLDSAGMWCWDLVLGGADVGARRFFSMRRF